MKTITGYLKPYIGRMILGFIVKVLGTFMELGLPWVLAYMIDEVIPQNSYSLIALWGVVMLVLAVGARVFNVKANQMASKVGRDTIVTIRHDLFVRIQNLSGRQLDYFPVCPPIHTIFIVPLAGCSAWAYEPPLFLSAVSSSPSPWNLC